jgi:hypothetical protein
VKKSPSLELAQGLFRRLLKEKTEDDEDASENVVRMNMFTDY